MTGAGAPGAAGIIHCLRQDKSIELTVADAREDAIGKHLSSNFVQIPAGDDPSFIDKVFDFCCDKKIDLVLPLVTKELLPFSKNKKHFDSNNIRLMVSDEEAIRVANDKSVCYRFLLDKGIRVPKFFVVKTIQEFIDAAEKLGHPQKPFCFKPSVSNGSRGVRIVHSNPDEGKLLFDTKPYQLDISYRRALEILSRNSFPELLLSEYLGGEEYSIDCIAQHGQAKLIVPRTRKKMINGISVEGEFKKNAAVIDYCSQIIEIIGLHGNIGLQIKYSDQDQPMLLEINPRVQGTIAAALGAGVNLPLLAVQQELGVSIDEEKLNVRWGTKFSRYWTEVFY